MRREKEVLAVFLKTLPCKLAEGRRWGEGGASLTAYPLAKKKES